jgi:transcriptional regulator with XRE-family HTH domain
LTDQIRDTVKRSQLTRYEICRQTGIDKASMSKFASGQRGLSLAHLDKLATLLGLRIVISKKVTSSGPG